MDTRILRQALRQTGSMRSKPGWFCPEEADLAAYVDGAVGAQQRRVIEKHIGVCQFCTGLVAVLARLHEEELVAPTVALVERAALLAKPRSAAVAPAWQWATVGVTAAVVMAVAVQLKPEDVPLQTPAERRMVAPTPKAAGSIDSGQEPGRPVRSAQPPSLQPELVAPQPGSAVSKNGLEFRWKPVAGSLYYELRLTNAAGDLIWEGPPTEKTQSRLPAEAEARLIADARYFAWVVAHLPDGRTTKSKVAAFRIKS